MKSPYIVHLRDKKSPRGGITIAMERNTEGLVTAYAKAICHENDNFVRHTGVVKATGRLKSKKYRVDISDQPMSVDEVVLFVDNMYGIPF